MRVNLANNLAERGFAVDLILVEAAGPYLSDVADNVHVVDLGSRRVATSIPKLACYLRQSRPDALLSAMGHTNIAALVARYLSGVRCRLVVSEHSHLTNPNRSRPSWRGVITRRLRSLLYPKADAVVAVSSGVADDLANVAKLQRSAISVIYNPATTPQIKDMCRDDVEHPWLRRDDVRVIMGMGRLTAAKDFATLIRAFGLFEDSRDLRLIILGDGDLRPELEAQIHHQQLDHFVSIPGFVLNPYAYLARASVFALTSRWEGFGNVLVEAMACGTPVVSTDCDSGPAEILEGGAWGRLVPVGDAEALAHALRETLTETVTPNVEQRAQEFTVDSAADAYVRLLLAEEEAVDANNL